MEMSISDLLLANSGEFTLKAYLYRAIDRLDSSRLLLLPRYPATKPCWSMLSHPDVSRRLEDKPEVGLYGIHFRFFFNR